MEGEKAPGAAAGYPAPQASQQQSGGDNGSGWTVKDQRRAQAGDANAARLESHRVDPQTATTAAPADPPRKGKGKGKNKGKGKRKGRGKSAKGGNPDDTGSNRSQPPQQGGHRDRHPLEEI